jgi:hypothetical protein
LPETDVAAGTWPQRRPVNIPIDEHSARKLGQEWVVKLVLHKCFF